MKCLKTTVTLLNLHKDLPGTEYTLRFDDGEYLKRIKVKLTDDDISETDEQVMFVLMNETGAELAKPNTAYLNIYR